MNSGPEAPRKESCTARSRPTSCKTRPTTTAARAASATCRLIPHVYRNVMHRVTPTIVRHQSARYAVNVPDPRLMNSDRPARIGVLPCPERSQMSGEIVSSDLPLVDAEAITTVTAAARSCNASYAALINNGSGHVQVPSGTTRRTPLSSRSAAASLVRRNSRY